MNPEKDFNQYKENSFHHWRKSILIISSITSIIILLIEIGIFFALSKTNQKISPTPVYILLRIVIPTSLNFITLLIVLLICKSNKTSANTKNFAVTVTLFVISSVIAIFHSFFNILLVTPALPFFICTIFGDSKILRKLAILTVPTIIISSTIYWMDKGTGLQLYKLLTLLCSVSLIFCAFCYADSQVKFQKNQLDYIHLSYQRQFELLKELRVDPLTNIANRVSMKEDVTNAIYRAEKDNISSYLAMLDIDFFKNVNDRFGHTSGDLVLIKLAEILKANTEFLGKAYRYGGEEFIIVFENTNVNLTKRVIEKICSDFSKTRFDFSPNESYNLSAGISMFQKGSNIIQWIDNSDSALYFAKSHGRNQICFYEEIYPE